MRGVPSSLLSASWQCHDVCVDCRFVLTYASIRVIWLPYAEIARLACLAGVGLRYVLSGRPRPFVKPKCFLCASPDPRALNLQGCVM